MHKKFSTLATFMGYEYKISQYFETFSESKDAAIAVTEHGHWSYKPVTREVYVYRFPGPS